MSDISGGVEVIKAVPSIPAIKNQIPRVPELEQRFQCWLAGGHDTSWPGLSYLAGFRDWLRGCERRPTLFLWSVFFSLLSVVCALGMVIGYLFLPYLPGFLSHLPGFPGSFGPGERIVAAGFVWLAGAALIIFFSRAVSWTITAIDQRVCYRCGSHKARLDGLCFKCIRQVLADQTMNPTVRKEELILAFGLHEAGVEVVPLARDRDWEFDNFVSVPDIGHGVGGLSIDTKVLLERVLRVVPQFKLRVARAVPFDPVLCLEVRETKKGECYSYVYIGLHLI